MKAPVCARWLVGSALAGLPVTLHLRGAEAAPVQHLLLATSYPSTCNNIGNGDVITMEAWGYGVFHTKSCEAINYGGTAMATCAGGTNLHHVRIARRNPSTLAYVATLAGPSPEVAWTAQSQIVSFNVPNNSGGRLCTGGTVSAMSQGLDLENAPLPP